MNNEKSDSYPIFGQDETIGGEKWGEGDTLNYLEADEEGHKQYLPVCFEYAEQLQSAVPVPLVAEYRTGA